MIKKIESVAAPRPIAPYSQAIHAGDFLFISGHVGNDRATGRIVEGGVGAQAKRILDTFGAILEEAGLGYADVVKCEIYLKDINDFSAVNQIYGSYFGKDPKPARQAMQVAALPLGALIEMSCIAYAGK